jgi:hypothetical protein
MYEADSDTDGYLEQLYTVLETSPTVSISPDNDTNSTEESGSQSNSEHDSVEDRHMEDDVDEPDTTDLGSGVEMERDGDDEEEVHTEKVNDEEEDKYEDAGKEPRTIGQGEMVNTSAYDVDTTVDDQPLVLPEQGQNMHKHIPWPQPPTPAPWPLALQPFS